MKFMTRQWYQTMQDSCLGVCLRADERVAEYSEGLFQEVWAEKLADWLKLRRKVAELTKEPFADVALVPGA